MEARIFMNFETYVQKIVLDHQSNHKDPCKDARTRGVNARTHVKKNLCVRSLGYIVGASPPPVKICVSVRWGKLWVRPPPSVKICVFVRWGKLWVPPPHFFCENMCVRSLGYVVGASPLCLSFRWILACCLLRFAAFL